MYLLPYLRLDGGEGAQYTDNFYDQRSKPGPLLLSDMSALLGYEAFSILKCSGVRMWTGDYQDHYSTTDLLCAPKLKVQLIYELQLSLVLSHTSNVFKLFFLRQGLIIALYCLELVDHQAGLQLTREPPVSDSPVVGLSAGHGPLSTYFLMEQNVKYLDSSLFSSSKIVLLRNNSPSAQHPSTLQPVPIQHFLFTAMVKQKQQRQLICPNSPWVQCLSKP